jgi:hypothetical protein
MFARILGQFLPDRTKRMMFLASFSARVKDSPVMDIEVMKKLNRVLTLSSSESALKLPIHLSHAIWRGRSFVDICGEPEILEGRITPDRVQSASRKAVLEMPSWLRYSKIEEIERDVKLLLVHSSMLAA